MDATETAEAPKAKKRTAYPADFEAAWQAYPTDPIMSKKEAFEKWKRLSPEDRDVVTRAIPKFVSYCTQNPTYRPVHMCRFISQRRFDGFAPKIHADYLADDERWNKRLKAARLKSLWASKEWGPPPGQAGCCVPGHLLIEGDGAEWVEWVAAA